MTGQNARWAEGMEWTMRYLNKHGLKKGSSFEVRVKYADDVEFKGKVGNKIDRKTDLQVCPNGPKVGGCTYFEFKSVSEVPPPPFNDQFVKDLLNGDVKKLNQLKWVFDGKKFPEGYDFKGKMKEAIRKMDMPKEALEKFGARTEDELKTEIINNFDNIFQVK